MKGVRIRIGRTTVDLADHARRARLAPPARTDRGKALRAQSASARRCRDDNPVDINEARKARAEPEKVRAVAAARPDRGPQNAFSVPIRRARKARPARCCSRSAQAMTAPCVRIVEREYGLAEWRTRRDFNGSELQGVHALISYLRCPLAQGCFDALDQPLPLRKGTASPRTTKVRTMGKYGSRPPSVRPGMPASRESDCAAAGRARPLRIVGYFRGEFGKDDMQEPKFEGGGPAHRAAESTSFGPSAVMITLPGLRVGMAKPVARLQPIISPNIFGGDVLRTFRRRAPTSPPYTRAWRGPGGGGVL